MSCFSSLLRLNVLFSQLCLHFIQHFYSLRGIVLLESLYGESLRIPQQRLQHAFEIMSMSIRNDYAENDRNENRATSSPSVKGSLP